MAKKPSLRVDNLFLESILDNIPDMIFVKDAKSLRFVRFNKAGEKLLGRKQKDLIGKNDYDFFPKKEADFFTKKDRAVLKSKKLLDIPEEPIHTKRNGRRFLHTKKIPISDPQGRPQYLLGISEDITARKEAVELRKAERALRKSEERYQRLTAQLEQNVEQRTCDLEAAMGELEAFSYSVSHDLRAPLRAIEGFSKILLEDHAGSLSAEAKGLLSAVSKNALHMAQLIDDLLSFSRIARKDFVKHRVPMKDLAKVVADELQQDKLGAKCHIIVNTIPDAHGDAPLLRQVWTNLLANAIKFTRPVTSPTIEIGAQEDTTSVIYFVRDNGVGFDMQFANKLFGVFQRLHTTEEFEGTGVGLAIVQRIILKHGGRVWAEGRLNNGATFYFSLPKVQIAL